MSNNIQPTNFNAKITKFFLENKRLTILSALLLIIAGVASLFSLQTSGFPSPSLEITTIQTVYPGASANTVAEKVTAPIESEIKNIDGVKSYSSSSMNSVSFIMVYINSDADIQTVKNKVQTAADQANLPTDANTPKVSDIEIGGPVLTISVLNNSNNLADVYNKYVEIKKVAGQIPETAKVESTVDLEPKIKVVLDNSKILPLGITSQDIESQISFLGESIPVKSGVELGGKNTSLITSLNNSKSLESLKNISIISPVDKKTYKLTDLAEIKTVYEFAKEDKPIIGFKDNEGNVYNKEILSVQFKTVENVSLNKYIEDLTTKLKEIKDLSVYSDASDINKLTENETAVIFNYNQASENTHQVNEILATLFGGEFKTENQLLSKSGWIFGGIWLVFLVMLLFVSFRSAFIAILSFPLSVFFSFIYLNVVGENLNTIVLFSLVLTIGSVVDLTMVALEAVQRKIDAGLKGKEAVMASVNDVGRGLFLSMLTAGIVFLPFGVLSGLMGQIFAYIPKTIIPAIIGSYIVPIIFLMGLAGMMLKKSKTAKGTEEENLWPVAKWMVKFNTKMLNGSRLKRLGLIIISLAIPIFVMMYFTSSGLVKMVSFSSSGEQGYIQVSTSYLASTPISQQQNTDKEVLSKVQSYNDVIQTYSMSMNGENMYYAQIKDKQHREVKDYKGLADKIGEDLKSTFKDKVLEVKTDIVRNGPPASDYQVSIAVKNENLDILKSASLEVGKTAQKLCLVDSKIQIKDDCAEDKKLSTKVDDGYTNKTNTSINIILNKDKLTEYGLTVPNAPMGVYVNSLLRNQFDINNGDSVTTINQDGTEMEVILDKKPKIQKTLEDIKNTTIFTTTGKMVKLSEIANIQDTEAGANISRLKGESLTNIQIGLKEGYTDTANATLAKNAIIEYYTQNNFSETKKLGLQSEQIQEYSEGDLADTAKTFSELGVALMLAIFMTYAILVLFFRSFTQPLVILFTVPLVFTGMFPALAWLGGGELGFIEILGVIILVGLVVNVAIFLFDSANHKVDEGEDPKKAISEASGIRFRPIFLTKVTSIVSLLPLAINDTFYKPLALVIIFGLLTSGLVSLLITPTLYIFFKWTSDRFWSANWALKLAMILFFPITLTILAIIDWKKEKSKF